MDAPSQLGPALDPAQYRGAGELPVLGERAEGPVARRDAGRGPGRRAIGGAGPEGGPGEQPAGDGPPGPPAVEVEPSECRRGWADGQPSLLAGDAAGGG